MTSDADGGDKEDRPRRSQATRLVDVAFAAGVELWHTPAGDPYITIPAGAHREHHAVTGRALREWLARQHHQETGQTPGSQAIADALGTLAGKARYDGAEHAVSVRVAGHQGAIYLDLGGDDWRVVEITAAGWRLMADAPVRFRRSRGLLALPTPTAGGSVDLLRGLINVRSADDWRLIVAWLVGALKPTGPYPLLTLTGEQGAAKSTTARLLRRLVDPSIAELRAEPREIRDLMIAASGGWIVAFDNLSHIQPWLSDALCRISTGGALSTRQLYTDGDEHFLEAIRPVILTSIADVAIRGDLQDRAIAITLPPVPEDRRRPETDVWRAFTDTAPAILGALLDAVCCALRRERDVKLATLPRMADWAIWTTAAEPALGWPDGAVLAAYTAARQHDVEAGLDGDPLAVAIRALALPYEGTAAELKTRLTPATRPPRGWPESPRGLSAALRRLAPQLRRVGIEVILPSGARNARERVIRIEHREVGAQQDTQDAQDRTNDSLNDSPNPTCLVRCPVDASDRQQDTQQDGNLLNESGGLSDLSDVSCSAPACPQEAPTDGDGYSF